jgi:putative membrane protein
MSSDRVQFEESPLSRFLKERWLSLLLGVLALIFIVQNTDSTRLSLLWMNFDSPLWVVLALMLLIGIIVGSVRTKRRLTRKED